jgi:salicylate hydroxylase
LEDKWYKGRMSELGVKTRSCIHRARLLEELVALLSEGGTSFNKAFTHAEVLDDDGTKQLCFVDGSSARCAAPIGADGIHSRVRQGVCPDVKPVYARETACRSVVPRSEAIAALGEDAVLNSIFVLRVRSVYRHTSQPPAASLSTWLAFPSTTTTLLSPTT